MKYIIIILAIASIFAGCKKDNGITVGSIASEIGLQFEHVYSFTASYYGSSKNSRIIFHTNNTISEIVIDTFTYAATFTASTGNSTSILQGGYALKITTPGDTLRIVTIYPFYNASLGFNGSHGYISDTTVIGIYLTLPVSQNNKPTLGFIFPNDNTGSVYYGYLTK